VVHNNLNDGPGPSKSAPSLDTRSGSTRGARANSSVIRQLQMFAYLACLAV
jgi:hypothetical protein